MENYPQNITPYEIDQQFGGNEDELQEEEPFDEDDDSGEDFEEEEYDEGFI